MSSMPWCPHSGRVVAGWSHQGRIRCPHCYLKVMAPGGRLRKHRMRVEVS